MRNPRRDMAFQELGGWSQKLSMPLRINESTRAPGLSVSKNQVSGISF
jgi:hypothetical protein